MSSRRLKSILLSLALLAVTVPAFFCNSPNNSGEARAAGPHSDWRNVYDTSVHYVGMTVCRSCHYEIYNTFIQTGMGQSFDRATKQKSAADFSPAHALVYDKDKDFYYRPYWDGDSLTILEYRLEGGDTVHKRSERISYIVGSGQHTNSHIMNMGGYLYQAPITFYTQRQQWDLAPGFEKGGSSRFRRLIESECMTCHNALPDFVAASQNKYLAVKNGIDCERCHGPGSLHVAEKRDGKRIDTSRFPDYTIVNPKKLSTELQNNVCQRCHLQGIAVLNDGRNFFDFRPGMRLSEVMNVFMPQYAGADDKMIMASHVERMKKSPCYISSGKMSCITCHNPHVSVKFTPQQQYLAACASCHGGAQQVHCNEKPAVRAQKGDNCVTCHMPHNGSIDIPHVAVTDHFIRRRPLADRERSKITAFLGLRCFNNDRVDALTTARGYLEFFERYNSKDRGLIDSALWYLARCPADSRQADGYIRSYYLLQDYRRVPSYVNGRQPVEVKDAWTAYRIAEAMFHNGDSKAALPWYRQAVSIWPYSLDFQNRYGICLVSQNSLAEAQKTFEFILGQNPKHNEAACNLGYVFMRTGDNLRAFEYLERSLQLDPDYEFALINLATVCHITGDDARARQLLERLLKRHPENEQARQMLISL